MASCSGFTERHSFRPHPRLTSEGEAQGDGPAQCLSIPPGRNGRIRCCFNTFQSQRSWQCPMAETAKMAFRCLLVRRGSKNIQSGDSQLINVSHLFVVRLICPLCHFLKNLKYPPPPPGAPSALSGHLLQWSESVRAHYPQAARTSWAFHE